jgi:Putative zincin peptidase
MFFIPGFLISLVTFPGIIVHELAHQLFCRLQGVAILKTCYFQLGNPAGYVVHEIPKYPHQSLLIGIGPFLVNTIVGALVAFPAAIPVIKFGGGDGLDHTLIWLGVSIAMHAFPSRGDAESMNSAISTGDVPILLKIVTAPIVLLINLAALGRFFWLDLFYGVGVAVALPTLLVHLFA